jgi:hypothetical protein
MYIIMKICLIFGIIYIYIYISKKGTHLMKWVRNGNRLDYLFRLGMINDIIEFHWYWHFFGFD